MEPPHCLLGAVVPDGVLRLVRAASRAQAHRDDRGATLPLPILGLCISSIQLFLSGILYNKQSTEVKWVLEFQELF